MVSKTGETEDGPSQEAETERKSMENRLFRPKHGARQTPLLPAETAENYGWLSTGKRRGGIKRL